MAKDFFSSVLEFVDKITERKPEIDPKYLAPQTAHSRCSWDMKALKKLVQVLTIFRFRLCILFFSPV
jgi:hypothetical protein